MAGKTRLCVSYGGRSTFVINSGGQSTFAKTTANVVGRRGVEPLKSKDSGFTVRPIWPLWNLPYLKSEAKTET
jgi:hypothetical protein